jgi:hypothetical protein
VKRFTTVHPCTLMSKAPAFMLVGVLLSCLILMIVTHTEPAAATTCSGSLQAEINAARAGSTVTADPCVYREAVTVNKPLTLDGAGQAEIRGSDVWSSWTPSGGNWVSSQSVPTLPTESTPHCRTGTSRCAWPEQVYVDGVYQEQVSSSSDPGPGQFKIDGSRRVVLGSDPSGKMVEVTTRTYWLNAGADNVTIKRLV